MISISKNPNAPQLLIEKGVPLTAADCMKFDANPALYRSAPGINNSVIRKMSIDNKIYGDQTVKSALIQDQHEKCCFCEAKFIANGYGDVEHFRPKKAYKKKGDRKLTYPGYYWLGYDWNNLLFSCQICNQKYKKNEFPLSDESTRVQDHNFNHLLSQEATLLINPITENPENFVRFREEVPYPVNDNEKGKESIRFFGLKRKELNDIRLEYLKLVRLALPYANIDLGDNAVVDTTCNNLQITEAELIELVNYAREIRDNAAKSNKPFSGMIRSNFPNLPR